MVYKKSIGILHKKIIKFSTPETLFQRKWRKSRKLCNVLSLRRKSIAGNGECVILQLH